MRQRWPQTGHDRDTTSQRGGWEAGAHWATPTLLCSHPQRTSGTEVGTTNTVSHAGKTQLRNQRSKGVRSAAFPRRLGLQRRPAVTPRFPRASETERRPLGAHPSGVSHPITCGGDACSSERSCLPAVSAQVPAAELRGAETSRPYKGSGSQDW